MRAWRREVRGRERIMFISFPAEILLSSQIMSGVLADVENESTRTRPKPVGHKSRASRSRGLFSDPISRRRASRSLRSSGFLSSHLALFPFFFQRPFPRSVPRPSSFVLFGHTRARVRRRELLLTPARGVMRRS